MKTIGKSYAEFQRIVTERGLAPGDDFVKLCRGIGTSPSDLNEILEEEMGMDGYEIVHYFGNRNIFY
ncbi:MAG: hypothetical protein MJY56_08200 [Bacteroidales bacterium]|nr:hypothetical protein [Bacteroidales bacterium]